MGDIEFVITLLVAVALLVWVARHLSIPYPIVLVVGGLGLGALPGLPALELEPEVVFLIFIPPLVHAAGYASSPRHLLRDARQIALAAVVLVALTIVAVAVAAHELVGGVSWTSAFLLATVLAPTDLVAATAIFRRLGAPERIVNLIEGENLINDGTALTAWRLAVTAALAGSLTLGDAVEELVLVAAGGTAIGLVGGFVMAELRKRLDDSLIEITITILTPYLLYVTAEEAGVSGILAAVVSGIYLGYRHASITTPMTGLQAYGFWEVFVFLLESTLFVLVGLQFRDVLDALDRDAGGLIVDGLLISLVIMAVRLAYQFVVPGLDLRERLVVGWSGMRGAISLAVALAIPLSIEGREEILFLTIVVIVTTLVVQGLTLPLLIKRLHFEEEVPDERRQAMVRFRTIDAALERIGQLSFDRDGVPPAVIERARTLYAERASQIAGECRTGVPDEESDTAAWLRLRLELLELERERLKQLRDQGEITTTLMNAVGRDLDLELARLQRRMVPAGAA